MAPASPVAHARVGASSRAPVRLPRAAPVEVQSRPLEKEQLVDYFRGGCKPKTAWRIGTEHEKLVFRVADRTRAAYPEIKYLLDKIVDAKGWKPVYEGENIIGCKMDGQSVTLEPGGQFELSGAPLPDLHGMCSEVSDHLELVTKAGQEIGVGFLGVGFDPKWQHEDIPMMPKDRYNIMKAYMPKVGTLGLDMMFRSCTIQVNLDFSSEADMTEKLRIALALQPLSTALFATSPFRHGKPSGYQSWRGHVWSDVDDSRCGNLPFVFRDDFSFEKYVDYLLDVPMYFVRRNGVYIDATGASFRDFIEGKLAQCPGEIATMDDWEDHIGTAFPEVRMKRFLEMRGADGGGPAAICALPALWVGLLYDPQSQKQALELVSSWTQEERDFLWREVPAKGMDLEFRGRPLRELAQEVVALAKAGLGRRGRDEERYLYHVEKIAASGRPVALDLLDLYNGDWQQSIDPIYEHMKF